MHLGFRQADVAGKAGVSQSVVSRIERGQIDGMTVGQLEQVAAVLEVRLFLEARWMRGELDRLVDGAHAGVVEHVVERLRSAGWETEVEFGFNEYGERGSVDVLAWHPTERILLIVEVKSRLTDLQDTFASYARKVRLVPGIVRRDRGWDPAHVARLLVLPGTTANRTVVSRHAASFDSVLPERMPAIRSWILRPRGAIAGIWFVAADELPARSRRLRRRVRRAAGSGGARG